ncbi:hypothetical protein VPH35_028698 [Triticum aestivum]
MLSSHSRSPVLGEPPQRSRSRLPRCWPCPRCRTACILAVRRHSRPRPPGVVVLLAAHQRLSDATHPEAADSDLPSLARLPARGSGQTTPQTRSAASCRRRLQATTTPERPLARLQAVGGGRRPRWRRCSLRKRRPQRLPAPGNSRLGAERFPLRERWSSGVCQRWPFGAVEMALSGLGHQAMPYVAARRRDP